MSDETVTPDAPEPPANTGEPDASVLQGQLADAEAKRRSFQSENEQLKKQLADAKAAAAPVTPATPESPATPNFDPDAAAAQFYAALTKKQAVADAQRDAREKFPLADASVLNAQFETPEEVERAAKQSHDAIQKHRDEARAEADKALRAELAAKGVSLPAPQATPGSGEGAAPLTIEQIAALPYDEFAKLSDDVFLAAK